MKSKYLVPGSLIVIGGSIGSTAFYLFVRCFPMLSSSQAVLYLKSIYKHFKISNLVTIASIKGRSNQDRHTDKAHQDKTTNIYNQSITCCLINEVGNVKTNVGQHKTNIWTNMGKLH